MDITPRDYQVGTIEALRESISMKNRRIVLVAPTGAGKTTIAAMMINGSMSKGLRCLFLAHRKELIDQCSQRLDEFNIDHGVIQRDHSRTDPTKRVQVASVQTLLRRPHFHADLIIVDECHRSTAKSYKILLDRYAHSNPVIIGLTATPYRLDGKGLGDVYQDLVEVASVQNLIDRGFLVNPKVFGSDEPLDLSGVSTVAGDFNRAELAEVTKKQVFSGELVENWISRVRYEIGNVPVEDLKATTVVFAPNVEQSKKVVELFMAAGIKAAHVDANTPASERTKILKALRNREISVVSNVDILSEGWDLPHLEIVSLLRPTKSKALFKQFCGRVMRPAPGKRFAIIIDHANCTRMHGFVTDEENYSLAGREKRKRGQASAMAPHKKCLTCGAIVPMRAKSCPNCGAVQFKVEVVFTKEELVELTPDMVAKKGIPIEAQQEAYNDLCNVCISKGFRPNWARLNFMRRYGYWPSYDSGMKVSIVFNRYERAYAKREAEAAAQGGMKAISGEVQNG